MESVGDKGEGGAPTSGSAGEDCGADTKRWHIQSLVTMGRGLETGEEDATLRRQSRQQVPKYAPCAGVSGAQGVGQGAQAAEVSVHADIEAVDA